MISNEEFDVVITPKRKWYDLKLRELIKYKDLIVLLFKRSFISQYKQTILGPIWFFIHPVISALVSTVIFGKIAKISSDGIPYFLFYLVGNTLWNYFASCVSVTSSTFTANAGIMGKVYFPRLVVPISSVMFSAINMLIVFSISIVTIIAYLILGYDIKTSAFIFIVPILMIQTAVLGLGVGIIISSLTTKYRDFAVLVSFGLGLWMYLTPVVYPISEVPEKLKVLILLNPMSSVVQNYKYALLGVGSFEAGYWLLSLAITVVLFFTGLILFNRVEKTFMDTV